MPRRWPTLAALVVLSSSLAATARAGPEPAPVTIVTLGDSITKGVRAGVAAEETFAALVERALIADGVAARVVNLGIGGERTDQALKRLDAVAAPRPRFVTVMYGTNDSYVDRGATASRLSVADFRANLDAIAADLTARGITPILMTEPRWADDADPNGLGENPNGRLEPYLDACRAVAEARRLPLVDHYARWTEARTRGQSIRDWTTDGCHPNPRGHRGLADALLPVIREALKAEPAQIPARTRAKLEAGEPARIVCFGDSVTGVYYHTGSRRAYTDMLGLALRKAFPKADLTMINAGISGHTTRDALARIDRDVIRHGPTLVTVMFGLNDMTRVPLADYRANLAAIVERCRAAGAEVILCTPNNVITTDSRPSEKLIDYCEAVRQAGRSLNVPVCDVYANLDATRARDPLAWRLLMSDEIHPNMDGHKRMAEQIALSIGGRPVELADIPPPAPALPRTGERLAAGQPVRVLAMPPFDALIGPTLDAEAPGAKVEVTPWPTAGLTLPQLEQDARTRVRPLTPDLVVLAVPRSATAEDLGTFVHAYAWIMNSSLNFGAGGWDCVVVHPSVVEPADGDVASRDDLIRQLVRAQDLTLIDRPPGDTRPAPELFRAWLAGHPWRAD